MASAITRIGSCDHFFMGIFERYFILRASQLKNPELETKIAQGVATIDQEAFNEDYKKWKIV